MPKKKAYTLDFYHNIAESKGGKCLSTTYTHHKDKLKFKCNKDHVWETFSVIIRNGHWCPECARDALRLSIEDAQKLATEHDGECLSQEYKRSRDELIWKCKFGHIWKATHDNVKQGKWCPECSAGLYERLCRTYFELIFSPHKFPTTYPNWLVSPKKAQMELDGYCAELGIAFEYNGTQHYKKLSHISQEKFDYLKKCDQLKIKLCQKNNVKLFIIKEIRNGTSANIKNIQEQITKIAKLYNINFNKELINPNDLYQNVDKLEKYNSMAKLKNGMCISKFYINAHCKLEWECEKLHRWFTSPNSIQQGNWCPECAEEKRCQTKLSA